MFTCLWVTLDQSFKNDGAIGGWLKSPYEPDDTVIEVRGERIIYDQLFNFILLILLMEILAGLIIDMFGQLREESSNSEEDLGNYCIMCAENRENIERNSNLTFEEHITVYIYIYI